MTLQQWDMVFTIDISRWVRVCVLNRNTNGAQLTFLPHTHPSHTIITYFKDANLFWWDRTEKLELLLVSQSVPGLLTGATVTPAGCQEMESESSDIYRKWSVKVREREKRSSGVVGTFFKKERKKKKCFFTGRPPNLPKKGNPVKRAMLDNIAGKKS